MNEHEELKNISEIIWYSDVILYNYNDGFGFVKDFWDDGDISSLYDVREIIFTPEFIKKLVKKIDDKTLLGELRIKQDLWISLLWELENPVKHISFLLKNICS